MPDQNPGDPVPVPEAVASSRSTTLLVRAALAAAALAVVLVAAWRLSPVPVVEPAASPPAAVITAATPPAATPTTSPTAGPTTGSSPTPDAPPATATDPVIALRCKYPVAPIGATVGDGEILGAPEVLSSREALNAFLRGDGMSIATLPLAGYSVIVDQPSWVVFAHQREGRPVAVIVVQRVTTGRWTVSRFAACDAADFDPSVPVTAGTAMWTDTDGERVAAATLAEVPDCYDGTQLRLDGRLYVRDPRGGAYDPDTLIGTYDADASLPATAIETGYRQGERRLFRATDDKAVFIVSPLRTERWPRVIGDEVIRIDCN